MLMRFFETLQLFPCLLFFITGGALVLVVARAVLKQKNEKSARMHQKIEELEASYLQLLEELGALKRAQSSVMEADKWESDTIISLRPFSADAHKAVADKCSEI